MRFIDSQQPLPADALLLGNDADVTAHAAALAQHGNVVLQFPKWTDGRAYSQASLLRGRLHYAGELIASGEVLVDMLPLLQRCGFSAVQLRADQDLAAARRALGFFETPGLHYQTVPPERQPGTAA